jgi:acyl-CoA synthetase (NDP forming)
MSRALAEPAAKRLLAAVGIAVPRSAEFGGDEPVAARLAGLRRPFALKAVAPGLLHKSDVGGVALALADDAAVEAARAAMLRRPELAGASAFLVEEMAPPGHELVIGARRDPAFGPVVMLGLGGVFVEILGDVSFRLAPLTAQDVREMLAELRALPVLRGARGGVVADEPAIVDAVLRLAGPTGLMLARPDIVELDINPLIVSAEGAVAVDARVIIGEDAPTPTLPRLRGREEEAPGRGGDVLGEYAPLFLPRQVAVLGASTSGGGPAGNLLRQLREIGYQGRVYPVHPNAAELDGRAAYPSLAALPEPVDYAFVALAAPRVAEALRAGAGRVRFAQVMSSGFAEEPGGSGREAELAASAREAGIRLIGPNCLGTYSPRGRLTFLDGLSGELGPVGLLGQSGGLVMDALRRGERRGLRFSGAVTLGNCADLGAADLLEFFLADDATRVVGLYLEGSRDARRLFELLRDGQGRKPVVLLRGGRTGDGQRAASSHTGALASDERIWNGLACQVGIVQAGGLDDFVDALLALQLLQPRERATERVALFGNGGGTSVLAADAFAREGFAVAPFGAAAAAALAALALPAGSSIANPIDVPANILRRDGGRVAAAILDAVCGGGEADAVVMHVNMPVVLAYRDADILGNLLAAALATRGRQPGGAHFLLVLRADGEPEVAAKKEGYRERALAAGIPVFDEPADAARALAALRAVERWRGRADSCAALPGSSRRQAS